ncbi:MAG: hypothetical protein ACTHW2_05165 [Tissierella sp.]|uniref:hypothetical protein n=1 Tax=Tissierella sp. TaxID=41274 RepID=UPI003F9A7503
MKKLKFISILLLLSVLIVACNGASSNEGLDMDEVLNNMEENSEDLKSVSENVEFKIENNINNELKKMEQEMESVFLYGEEGTITHIHTKQKSVANGQQQTMEFIKIPGEAHIYDGIKWQKYTGSENYSTTYKPVMDTLLTAKNGMEMKEEEDSYVFYFKGRDAAVYDSIRVPFNLSYQGVKPGDIDLDITFKINKENMNMENAYIGSSVSVNDDSSDAIGEIEFFDFDETEDIELPDEVKSN